MPSDRIAYADWSSIINVSQQQYMVGIDNTQSKPEKKFLYVDKEAKDVGKNFEAKYGFPYAELSSKRIAHPYPHNTFKVVVWLWNSFTNVHYVGKLSPSVLSAFKLNEKVNGRYMGVSFFDRGGVFVIERVYIDPMKPIKEWYWEAMRTNVALNVWKSFLGEDFIVETALGHKG